MAEIQPTGDIPSGSVLIGSESDFDIACQPCYYEGKNVEADGYCLDCCEYLCFTCYRYHKNLAITRHHKLLDKGKMPTMPDCVKVKDICTERCQNHENEIVTYFCPTHKVLGCSICITIKHSMCENVAYIPEVARYVENSEEYKAFQTRLKNLMLKSENTLKSASENINALVNNYTEVLKDIDTYKNEIILRLNELENKIKNRIEEIKRSDTERMNTASDTVTGVQEELQSISTHFETLLSQKQYCQMFTDMKSTERKLSELQDKLKEMEDNCVTIFRFQADEEWKTVIGKRDASWKVLERRPAKINITHVADVNMKSKTNSKTCTISGATVLSKEKIVIADFANGTVKLIDPLNKKIMSELMPEEYPWDVTTVSKSKVAITLTSAQKVLFLKCDIKLVVDREIKVNGYCRGIDCAQDRLFVTYESPCKVEIMDMSGKVLQNVVTNDQGDRLFSDPRYVSVSANKQSIYVSDWDKHSVIQINMDGNVMAEYKDDELNRPSKVVVDKVGMVYLCGVISHNIHLLTPGCRKVKILLKEKDGLKYPRSICYCEETDRLYIGMFNKDIVQVYQVK